MPQFASIAAYVVIDTLVLVMWHQSWFSRVCGDALHLPHLKALIDYYFSQCNPAPLMSLLSAQFLSTRQISALDTAFHQDLA